jgi:hypothetical protein
MAAPLEPDRLARKSADITQQQGRALARLALTEARTNGTYTLRLNRIDMVSEDADNTVVRNIVQWLRRRGGFRVTNVDPAVGITLDWSSADLAQPAQLATQSRAAADTLNAVPSVQEQLESATERGRITNVPVRIPAGETQESVAAALQAAGYSAVWSDARSRFLVDLTPATAYDETLFTADP